MAGFLGYDPARVATLRRALAAALTEAETFRCGDGLATDANACWRHAATLMSPWEGRLVSILSCAFDTPYQPVPLSVERPVDLLRPLDLAWTITADPMAGADPPLDPLARVEELVAVLEQLDLDLLGHPDQVARLVAILEATLTDDAARRRLFELLDPATFAAIVHHLGPSSVSYGGEGRLAPGARQLLDELGVALGRSVTFGEVDGDGYLAALLGDDDHPGDPYEAARILVAAHLPPAQVAAWASAILARSHPEWLSGLDAHVGYPEPRSGELVLEALANCPEAARELLRTVDDLSVLLGPQLQGEARAHMLIAAVDPDRFAVADTVALLQRVLTFLDGHRSMAGTDDGIADLHDALGEVIGPHLLDLVPTPLHPVAGWGPVDVGGLLSWIARSSGSAESLLLWIDRDATRAAQAAAKAPTNEAAIAQLGTAGNQLGTVLASVKQGQVAAAKDAHDQWHAITGLASLFLDRVLVRSADVLAPAAAPLAEVLGGTAAPWLITRGDPEPPRPDDVGVAIDRAGDALQARVGLAAATALEQRQASMGALPMGQPPHWPDVAPGEDGVAAVGHVADWAGAAGVGAQPVVEAAALAVTDFGVGRTARGRDGTPAATKLERVSGGKEQQVPQVAHDLSEGWHNLPAYKPGGIGPEGVTGP